MIAEIVFAAGCFWGVEKYFENIDGVIDVKSGYTGGSYNNPTYKDVLKYRHSNDIKNHTEAVKVTFDNSKINASKLIKEFWEIHNPTQFNRQGNDIGNNYRSAIFYTNQEQKQIALNTKATYQNLLKEHGFGDIVTQIEPLEKFYPAEEYHQNYLTKNPNGYCPNHSTGVKFTKENQKKEFITPLNGKEIIVVEAEFFCPYCEKFKKEVSSHYNGTIPLRTINASKLKNFDITTTLDATPTILFMQDGKEVAAYKGFINNIDFYKALGKFKLGDNSESFNVAFNKGTDNKFCKQYDIFKNTGDGVFIDKLSGDMLFDTRDRFNSNTGWLSFYKAIDNSVIEKPDYSYGMIRTEIIAKKSGIHLGHVFDEFNKRRFCINATILEFVPRNKIKNMLM